MRSRKFIAVATAAAIAAVSIQPADLGATPAAERGAPDVSAYRLSALLNGRPIKDAARDFRLIAPYVPDPTTIRSVGAFDAWRWYLAPGYGTRLCLISRGPGTLIGVACAPNSVPYRGGLWVAKARPDGAQVVAMVVPNGYAKAAAVGSLRRHAWRVRHNMIFFAQRQDVTVRLTGRSRKARRYAVPDLVAHEFR